MSYTIKPLEWKPVWDTDHTWRAETPLGVTYHAFKFKPFEWSISQSHIGTTSFPAESFDAAKQAAQDDYEKRLVVALEEVSSPHRARHGGQAETGKGEGMKTAFAVSNGEYEVGSVSAVFADEATARKWAETMNGGRRYDSYRVESFPFIEAGIEPYRATRFYATVELPDGGEPGIRYHESTDWAVGGYDDLPPLRPKVRYVRAPYHNNRGGRLEVFGSTAESVRKVTSERIAAWKAGVWGGPDHDEILEGGDCEAAV